MYYVIYAIMFIIYIYVCVCVCVCVCVYLLFCDNILKSDMCKN